MDLSLFSKFSLTLGKVFSWALRTKMGLEWAADTHRPGDGAQGRLLVAGNFTPDHRTALGTDSASACQASSPCVSPGHQDAQPGPGGC